MRSCVMRVQGLNVHDVIRHEFLVITKSCLHALTERLASEL